VVFKDSGARLVGGVPGEVVMMNGLTANLHLMMATFYRPTRDRHKILVEDSIFPSDHYAVRSQALWHGHDPDEAIVVAKPRAGEPTIRAEDIEALLEERGAEISLVLMPGVQFLTGQLFDMERIVLAAHRAGCVAGFDLAHAAGNVPLRLHDWNVDFAVWCSYKYLNAGPGAIAGCFVHERHGKNRELPRLAGWWGNDPARRFQMHLEREFVPQEGAAGWQLSNPPILAMAPLRASLRLFDAAGVEPLRAKSRLLTGYLLYLIDRLPGGRFEITTPRAPEEHGCQLSLRVLDRPKEMFRALESAGVVGDFREPDIVRVAPVPLYNTFHEVWRFARVLEEHLTR
jgi:kynureninase